jgi:plasmid stabilization system protein ParE
VNHLPLIVKPRAEQEAQEAARWYNNESPGVGVAFLDAVEEILRAIQENPHRFPRIHRDTRRALLSRFPYGVYFRLQPKLIKVLAIMHLSRAPIRWQERI